MDEPRIFFGAKGQDHQLKILLRVFCAHFQVKKMHWTMKNEKCMELHETESKCWIPEPPSTPIKNAPKSPNNSYSPGLCCLSHLSLPMGHGHHRVSVENARRPTRQPGAPSAFWPLAEATKASLNLVGLQFHWIRGASVKIMQNPWRNLAF